MSRDDLLALRYSSGVQKIGDIMAETKDDADVILEKIERVDPHDTDTLDEIDARVCAYYNEVTYTSHHNTSWFGFSVHAKEWDVAKTNQPKYTRSRDALKATRPEGWSVYIMQVREICYVKIFPPKVCSIRYLTSEYLPTEELAELHAIIQAIKHERKESND